MRFMKTGRRRGLAPRRALWSSAAIVVLLLLGVLSQALPPPQVYATEPDQESSTVVELMGAPIVFEEFSGYIRLNFTMFTVDFYKDTAGYNVIYNSTGDVVVYEERQVLQYLQGPQWKQRGTPYELSWLKVNDYQYNVTRHYMDYLGTFYNVTFIVRSDSQIKSVISLASGQTDEYRLLWQLSGIVHDNWVEGDNRLAFGGAEGIAFDWRDVYETLGNITETLVETAAQGKKADIYFNIGVIEAGQRIIIDPATVATSTTYSAIKFSFQRNGFYAEGLFWAFYSDGTDAGWKTSANGVDWSGFTSIGNCIGWGTFSVWFDEATGFVHYARFYDYDLFYRRGTVVNDGSINWSAVEQTVNVGSSGDAYQYPGISVDTNGYAWIGVYTQDPAPWKRPYVLKNANNDGTWALDFAYELNAVTSTWWRVSPVPLTGGKVYVIYGMDSAAPLGNLWNGAAWVGEENDLADFDLEYPGDAFSAGASGDNVHFVYLRDVTNQIRHNERVWGVGWDVADVLVQDAVSNNIAPALSIDPSANELYGFWTDIDTDHVYYKKYSGGAWGGLVDWIDESIDDIQYDDLISSFYMDYGGYIGLLYITKTGSPYKVRFAYLEMPPDNAVPTNDACDGDTYFDVDTYGWVKQTVTDVDGVADLKTVDIQVTTLDSKVFTLRWTQSSNTFSEVSDPDGIVTLDVSGSQRVNIDSDTDRIEFKFKISAAAQKGFASVQATVIDDADAQDQDNYADEFSINFYLEITIIDSSHGWTSIAPGATDVLINSPGDGDIDLTITANADFSLQAKGSGALTAGGESIPLANVKVHATTLGSAIALTISYVNIPGLTSQTRGVGVSKSFKLWISVPSPNENGDFVYTLSVQGVDAT